MAFGKVFVTGGAGYIGSHTCKLLSASGFDPIVYDNLSTGHREFAKWGEFVEGDIRDDTRLVEALRHHRPVAVIHFAALAYVGESVEHPAKYYDVNVVGSQRLLDACRLAKVRNLVFSSSCATYGTPSRLPIAESDLQRPISPYGWTKLVAEQMIRDSARAYGLRYTSLRYFNAAGADPDGVLCERHSPETHLIPLALQSAAGRIPFLSVFGDDYPTPDGTCIRDFIHVSDLAVAHVLALKRLLDGGGNAEINLGAGIRTSIGDVLRAIRKITARSVPIRIEARRPGDPPELVADTRAAVEKLGFTPRLSDLETIIRTAAPSFGLAAAEEVA
jgi:UDP-arabinose 4-epimerase